MRAESYFEDAKYEKSAGRPFLTERRTAKPFGYNGIFDMNYFRGESRDLAKKRGLLSTVHLSQFKFKRVNSAT